LRLQVRAAVHFYVRQNILGVQTAARAKSVSRGAPTNEKTAFSVRRMEEGFFKFMRLARAGCLLYFNHTTIFMSSAFRCCFAPFQQRKFFTTANFTGPGRDKP